MREPAKRIAALDLLRSVSILVVMAGHWQVYLDALALNRLVPEPAVDLSWRLWHLLTRNGAYGVSVFFVTSGFLITRWIRERSDDIFRMDPRCFYVRRLARIAPLMALAVLFGAVMVAWAPPSLRAGVCYRMFYETFDAPFWTSLVTMTFNWLRMTRLNFGMHWDVLWSLSIEEQFYIFYPVVILLARRQRTLVFVLSAAVLAGPLSRVISYHRSPGDYLLAMYNSLSGFDLIAMGCLTYLATEPAALWLGRRRRLCAGLTALGAALIATVYLGTSYTGDGGRQLIYASTLLGLGVCLFLAGSAYQDFFESLALRPLLVPGKLCYGLYLWHATAVYLLWPWMARADRWLGFLAFALVATGIAAVSYRFFEVPAARSIARRLAPRTQ